MTDYWWQTAIELPKLYTSIFFDQGPITAIWAFLKYLFQFSLSEHARQTFFALIILSALAYWVQALALLWQIKSSERILTAGRLGDLESRRRGGLGRGS